MPHPRRLARRLALVLTLTALLCLTAYGVGWVDRAPSRTTAAAATADRPAQPAVPAVPAVPVRPAVVPAQPVEPAPTVAPLPALLETGDEGDDVRELQARLAEIDWFAADVTGYYGDVTTEAVRGFQAKRGLPVTGAVDAVTLRRLEGMTSEPTAAALRGETGGNVAGPLDPRCTTGRVVCVDKTSDTLRWVVDGEVLLTVDVRFGGSATPTREGAFAVHTKSRDHVSSLYDTSMPFAMFFSGGQAVHYSPDFAAVGYAGASHGCVNVRDLDAVAWLYDQVAVGDPVVVYRS